jgi:hypothetical protein
LLAIFIVLVFSFGTFAQEAECANLTVEIGLKKRTIRKSKNPIVFKVFEDLTAQMIYTNDGRPNTLMAELIFETQSGYLVDLGSILTLNFEDGTHTDFIASSRKSFTSVAYFTLLKPGNRRAEKVMAFEDRLLYERLIHTKLTSLDYSIDGKRTKLTVSDLNSEVIKKTVACLIFTERDEEN